MNAAALDMRLSGDKDTPIYQQIKEAIRHKISQGEWQAGQMIPSENQLAEALGASRMTINRPLRELAAEGVLRRVHGLGTFVAEPARQAHLIQLVAIADEIKQQGKTHRAKLLELKQVTASQALGERMQVTLGAALFKVVMVHYQDEVPIQMEFRHINPSLVPDFLQVDFTSTTPAEYLISQIRPDELEHVVQAIMPSELMLDQLQIPASEPCLKLLRRTFKAGDVVTSAELVYPSSRYDLGARFAPTNTR